MSMLDVRSLTKRFGGLTALDNLDLQVEASEIVGIIGPNGAGKTTFFNLLTGLYLPTKGNILFAGRDITKVPPYKRVTLGIIRTFQLVSVFDSLPVIDNLALSTIRFGE